MVVVFGSFLRPVSGLLADRWGGYRILIVLLAGVALCLGGVATLPPAGIALSLLAGAMAMLGMGTRALSLESGSDHEARRKNRVFSREEASLASTC